jgi:hypothetical protein
METQTISEAKEKCNYITEFVLRFIGPKRLDQKELT